MKRRLFVSSPQIAWRHVLGAIATVLLGVVSRTQAAAIFDYPGIPGHEGHYTWTDGVPHFHQHHFHNTTHDAGPPDARAGHDVAHQLSGNRDYDAYSHWVNETYRVFDGGADNSLFGHGYIIETSVPTPEYRFEGDAAVSLFDHTGAAFDARQTIRDAFDAWSNIVVDDAHLTMGLAFREFVGAIDPAEITVRAVDFIAGAVARWRPATRELEFRRYDHATNRTAADRHRWYIGGDRATFVGLANPNTNLDDLLTVALHETGHIVGLDHQTDIDDIMENLAGEHGRVSGGGTFRVLSDDDILGARDLYTIPVVPEPASMTLLGIGALGLVAFQRRRRE